MSPTKTSLGLLFVDKKTVFFGILILAAAFAIGVLIGYYGKGDEIHVLNTDKKIIRDYMTDQFKENHVSYYCHILLYKNSIYIIPLHMPLIYILR